MKPLLTLIAALLLVACSSTRHAVDVTSAERPSDMTAHCSYKVKADRKTYRLGGTLKMKRGELVQMSLTLLGFEVMRIEFTPSGILIVDRANKQFIEGGYDTIDFARDNSLDFASAEALFWGEPCNLNSRTLRMSYGRSTLQVPTKMKLSLNSLSIDMSLSRVHLNTGREFTPTVIDRTNYRALPANRAINAIVQMGNNQ